MKEKEIQLFKPVYYTEEVLSQIRQCLDIGWTGLGFKTVEFEEKFKEYVGIQNAHFLNSATSGLHLALEIIKVRGGYLPKDLVITTPITFISDTMVIHHARKSPVFVDVGGYITMDPTNLEIRLEKFNTYKNTLAIIYVGIGGNTGNLDRIIEISNQFEIPLILDAAHMMGTTYHGKHIGNEADFTVFSFHSVKNLPTADGGMLVCRSKEDDKLARKLSWLGIDKDTYSRQTMGGNWQYNVTNIGWKYHGNSIMAAMGIAGLKHLNVCNYIRQKQAKIYEKNLRSEYLPIPMAPNCKSSRHLFQVRVYESERDKIISYARHYGIQLGVHYTSHSEYSPYSVWKGHLPNAELLSKQLISLPIGPHLNDDDIHRVIGVMNGYSFRTSEQGNFRVPKESKK